MKRTETDSLGTVEIDATRYWGPQTERARALFRVGTERFSTGLIRALGLQKQAAAEANLALGELPRALAAAPSFTRKSVASLRRSSRTVTVPQESATVVSGLRMDGMGGKG